MAGHHFICYSRRDAGDFAHKLAKTLRTSQPPVQVWLDRLDINPGQDWGTEIERAIQDSESVLFVMTRDSVQRRSECANEWSCALRNRKHIMSILLHADADMPFRLGDRQYIDFTGDFDSAVAKLRDHLEWLASPEGKLQTLEHKLADAEYDLTRTTDNERRSSIASEITHIEQQIVDLRKSLDVTPEDETDFPADAKREQKSDDEQRERASGTSHMKLAKILGAGAFAAAVTILAVTLLWPDRMTLLTVTPAEAAPITVEWNSDTIAPQPGTQTYPLTATDEGRLRIHRDALLVVDTVFALEEGQSVHIDVTRYPAAWTYQLALQGSTKKHRLAVTGIAVTPDGKRAISASWDSTLKVWDIETGKEIDTLEGHTHWVRAVAVTDDGKKAISASFDSTLKVWDIETGETIHTLKGHTDRVIAVAVTEDGKKAISASDDSTLKVWDIETGEEIRTFEGQSLAVNAVAVIDDGRKAISASDDSTLKVWDIKTGNTIRTLKGHTSGVCAVAVTDGGKKAISASYGGTLKVWDIETGDAIRTLKANTSRVEAVAVTDDGLKVILATLNQTLKVLDIATDSLLTEFECNSALYCCTVAHDGETILTAGYSGKVYILRLERK